MELFHELWRLGWRLRAWEKTGLQPGALFPDFALTDLEGRRHRLWELFPGKGAALWFTNFCEDCRARMPLLEELQREAGGRFEVLAVSLLGKDEALPRRAAQSCAFPVLLDPEDVVGRKLGLPHPLGACPLFNFFLLDNQGRILFRHHLSALAPDRFRKLWRGPITAGGNREAGIMEKRQ